MRRSVIRQRGSALPAGSLGFDGRRFGACRAGGAGANLAGLEGAQEGSHDLGIETAAGQAGGGVEGEITSLGLLAGGRRWEGRRVYGSLAWGAATRAGKEPMNSSRLVCAAWRSWCT